MKQLNKLTEAQIKDRERNFQLHMKLLQHTATCLSSKCPLANCTKLKGFFRHTAACQVKARGGCILCRRMWVLLQMHARQCKQSQCPVPKCTAIREKFRQQLAMDELGNKR